MMTGRSTRTAPYAWQLHIQVLFLSYAFRIRLYKFIMKKRFSKSAHPAAEGFPPFVGEEGETATRPLRPEKGAALLPA